MLENYGGVNVRHGTHFYQFDGGETIQPGGLEQNGDRHPCFVRQAQGSLACGGSPSPFCQNVFKKRWTRALPSPVYSRKEASE
jgi:hypothetical protein